MKNIPWILAATTAAAAAAAYIVLKTPGPQYATGSDNIEDAARGTSQWGSRNRIAGSVGNLFGKLKEGVGRATGNSQLADEGANDQLAGSLKNAAGEVAQAAGQTLHDFNR